MALTRRGKAVLTGAAAATVGVAALAFVALSGNAPGPLQTIADSVGISAAPPECPLTGEQVGADAPAPDRVLLAVKVENTPDAQPLVGLDRADIVYEEVVEGGITRFVVLFECDDSPRVGPVRSARTTDPKILSQFSKDVLLAYSGAAARVDRAVDDAGLIALTEASAPEGFERDTGRAIPHNLFAGTKKLRAEGRERLKAGETPRAVFVFDEDVPKPSKRIASATVVFSGLATADWRWEKGRWLRYLDGAPMVLENGKPITADNVVIQLVETREGEIHDTAGYPSPEVQLLGEGKAWVLRNGKVIAGRWERASDEEVTVFRTRKGEEIALSPGTTFVELAPTGMFDAEISFDKPVG